ncbi:hypothetical protein C8J57DRAFT_1721612 [Mycena rebaudengoi]|nr:hypothetical protein C8J57DRAFT_1721612 [Mycena rebaudengoi]
MTGAPRQPSTRGSHTKGKENLRSAKKSVSSAKVAATEAIDPYGPEFEQKFNIEGNNVQEIVYLRQDNDAVNQKLAEQQELMKRLQRELDALKTRPGLAADLTNHQGEHSADGVGAEVSDDLAKENAEVRKKLAKLKAHTKAADNEAEKAPAMIPRPAGSAGNDFSIEFAMGLGTNRADDEQYKALMRNIRDLTLQARINWEEPWSQTPAGVKAQLFAVARERHPYLARFTNDWATEEIVKQFIKNKRRNYYKHGWLEPPAKYAYLKANSAQRDKSAPRRKRQLAKVDNAKKASKKKASAKAGPSTKANGKKKAKVIDTDDEDDQPDDPMGEGVEGDGYSTGSASE